MTTGFPLGRLGWEDVELLDAFRDPTTSNIVGSSASWLVVIGAVFVVGLLTVMRWW